MLTQLGYGSLTQDLGNSWGVGVLVPVEPPPSALLTRKGSYAGVIQGRPRDRDRAEIEARGFVIHLDAPLAGQTSYYVSCPSLAPILALDSHTLPGYFWPLPEGVPLTLELILDWADESRVFNAQSQGGK